MRVGVRVASLIPDARLEVLDTGHVPHTSDPQGFASFLIPFADNAFAPLGTPA